MPDALCEECGYDLSAAESLERGRFCVECGRVVRTLGEPEPFRTAVAKAVKWPLIWQGAGVGFYLLCIAVYKPGRFNIEAFFAFAFTYSGFGLVALVTAFGAVVIRANEHAQRQPKPERRRAAMVFRAVVAVILAGAFLFGQGLLAVLAGMGYSIRFPDGP